MREDGALQAVRRERWPSDRDGLAAFSPQLGDDGCGQFGGDDVDLPGRLSQDAPGSRRGDGRRRPWRQAGSRAWWSR